MSARTSSARFRASNRSGCRPAPATMRCCSPRARPWGLTYAAARESAMRAAVLQAFGQPLSLTDVATPEPAADEVLVQVEACGVCHSDLHIVDGDSAGFRAATQAAARFQAMKSSARSPRRGADVSHLDIGQRVGVAWLHSACGALRAVPRRPREPVPALRGHRHDGRRRLCASSCARKPATRCRYPSALRRRRKRRRCSAPPSRRTARCATRVVGPRQRVAVVGDRRPAGTSRCRSPRARRRSGRARCRSASSLPRAISALLIPSMHAARRHRKDVRRGRRACQRLCRRRAAQIWRDAAARSALRRTDSEPQHV